MRNQRASSQYDTMGDEAKYDEVARVSVPEVVYSTPIPEHYLRDSDDVEDVRNHIYETISKISESC